MGYRQQALSGAEARPVSIRHPPRRPLAYHERLKLEGGTDMRFAVRFVVGFGVMLSTSSMATAQLAPGARNAPDPLLKREFRALDFGQPNASSQRFVGWPEMRSRAIDTLGAPLPSVTVAPDPSSSL